MVIPLGGLNDPLHGSPPPELEGMFSKVRYCLWVMIGSMLVKLLVASVLFGPLSALFLVMNILVTCLVGVFLMKDDVYFGKIHSFLMTSVFASCPRCNGGLTCLFPFVFINFVTVALDVLFGPTLTTVISSIFEIGTKNEPLAERSTPILFWVLLTAQVVGLVAQGVAAYLGWQAYKATVELIGGPEMSNDQYQALSGGPPQGAWSGSLRGGASSSTPQRQVAAVQQPFRPFSGEGKRLGGD